MSYIVWYLISPWDGYATTECATLKEAVVDVKRQLDARPQQEGQTFKDFLNCETGRLILCKGKYGVVLEEIFITSGPVRCWPSDEKFTK
jgi:hypothetical protein